MKKLLSLLIFSLAFATATATPQEAVEQVRGSAVEMLRILNQDNGNNSEQVRKQAEEYAIPHFDFQRMTALAVGRPWRQATPSQKTALTQAFKNKLIGIYSGTMLQYKSAKVNIKNNPIVRNNGRVVMVASEISPKANQIVNIDYTMYKSDDQYRVYDVKVEGQSLVTIYRNQFAQIIDRKGIDGLIAELEKDVAQKAK